MAQPEIDTTEPRADLPQKSRMSPERRIISLWLDSSVNHRDDWFSGQVVSFMNKQFDVFQVANRPEVISIIRDRTALVARTAERRLDTATSTSERMRIAMCKYAVAGQKELTEAICEREGISLEDKHTALGVAHLFMAFKRAEIVRGSVDRQMHDVMEIGAFYLVSAATL